MSTNTTEQDSVTVLACHIKQQDYFVQLERKDGSTLTVMIPREDVDTRASRAVSNGGLFGLNLVSEEHYT